jgi:3-hydroxybutyryl-CoA dehydratase
VNVGKFPVAIGDEVAFSKTVGESDVYQFAGITGDFARVHVDEAFMQTSPYGRRIAHGVLLVGFMSTTSTMILGQRGHANPDEVAVSLGYDRIRFLAPVFIGDTVTVTYRIAEIDEVRRRSKSKITVINQRGEEVAIAEHILKWVTPQLRPARQIAAE